MLKKWLNGKGKNLLIIFVMVVGVSIMAKYVFSYSTYTNKYKTNDSYMDPSKLEITPRSKDEIIAEGLVEEAITKDDFIRIICPGCIGEPGPVVSISSVVPVTLSDGEEDRAIDGVVYVGLSREEFIREICPECIADPTTDTIQVTTSDNEVKTYHLVGIETEYETSDNTIYVGTDYGKKNTILSKVSCEDAELTVTETTETVNGQTVIATPKLTVKYGDKTYDYTLSKKTSKITFRNKADIIADGIFEEAITKDDFIKIICPGCIAEPGDPIKPVVSISSVVPTTVSDGEEDRVIDDVIYVGLSREEFIREICPECIADPTTDTIQVTTSDGDIKTYYLLGIVTEYKTYDNTIYVGADYGNKEAIRSKINCEGAEITVIETTETVDDKTITNTPKLTVKYGDKTYEYELSSEEEPKVYGIIDYITDAGYKIDIDRKIIYNVTAETKVSEFKNVFAFAKNVSITDKNDTYLNDDEDANVATGFKVTITYDNDETEEYGISVLGDVISDGILTKNDAINVAKHIINGNEIVGDVYLKSADFNDDNKIKMNDVILMIKTINAKAK